jgi:type II secretory pathway pseudopilin PulG
MARRATRLSTRGAFTLTELLIAVGVLVVVVVAAARIFGAASKVSSVAEANADLLQTAAAIEAQVRADFANIPPNSFLVLQQVEVNQRGVLQTLDPALGNAEIRADQIAFFSRGARPTQQFVGYDQLQPLGSTVAPAWPPESTVARIYYGHGLLASTLQQGFGPLSYDGTNAPAVPWVSGAVETQNWLTGAPQTGTPRITAAKPSLWPLARIATLMTTDGLLNQRFASTGPNNNATQRLFTGSGNLSVQLGPLSSVAPTGATPFDPLWTSSRVDICKWQMDDLLTQMSYQYNTSGIPSSLPFARAVGPWQGPSTRLRMLQTLTPWGINATKASPSDASNPNSNHFVGYPRVEKAALGSARAEQMIAAPVLAANCSSFKVEWTYDDGVGRSWVGPAGFGPSGAISGGEPIGMYVRPGAERPWFGLDDGTATSAVRPLSNAPLFTNAGTIGSWGAVGVPLVVSDGTQPLTSSVEGALNPSGGAPIWPTSSAQGSKRVYQAVFGMNQSDAAVISPAATTRGPYTPLPSALRITMRLHDPLGRIEGGREFQFIVNLPQR